MTKEDRKRYLQLGGALIFSAYSLLIFAMHFASQGASEGHFRISPDSALALTLLRLPIILALSSALALSVAWNNKGDKVARVSLLFIMWALMTVGLSAVILVVERAP